MAESTLKEFVASQDELIREAGLALPHQFTHCTYPLGFLRQSLYLCLTCPEPRGICSACSIACHTKHEQVELFYKRNFRCDCSTEAIAHPCSLETIRHPTNEGNKYGQNFQGLFCRCGRTYDAQKEREAMIQCLSCEDWFHESCCNLRERPSSRDPTPEAPSAEIGEGPPPPQEAEANEDDGSEASFSNLPPPLITSSDYDSFVCGSCVRKIKILKKCAGTSGAIMVVRDTPDSEWRRIGNHGEEAQEDVAVSDDTTPNNAGLKRRLSSSGAAEVARESKRTRRPSDAFLSQSTPCLAQNSHPIASKIYEQAPSSQLGTGDLFLTDGFRERWCRCEDVTRFNFPVSGGSDVPPVKCRISLENHQYLVEEEENYDPPEDPDSGLSLEELGMRALSRLPRDRAIDGIQAFNKMRDGLKSFLQPFAEEGKVVNEDDVKDFFTAFTEAAKKGF